MDKIKYRKVLLGVRLFVDTNGKSHPESIQWEDGRVYEIDKVLSVEQAHPRHVGGMVATRYTCRVMGQVREIYHEEFSNLWYVEAPVV